MSEKKKGHGTRKHFQILLSEHRGDLFIQMMKEKEVKPTNWLRDKVYEFLEKEAPSELYAEAKQKDDIEWQQVVQNRLEGRALSKILKSIRNQNALP
tara:strand:- start:139 stop:429 length:291 start_codon:yes stop_codon:yes gene_type:complete